MFNHTQDKNEIKINILSYWFFLSNFYRSTCDVHIKEACKDKKWENKCKR